MYFVTVVKNGEAIVEKKEFSDYAQAIAYTSEFYQPKFGRVVLSFTTEVINGHFARSFATLTRPEDVQEKGAFFKEKYEVAAKQDTSFFYSGSYLFVIESMFGIRDAEAIRAAYESEE